MNDGTANNPTLARWANTIAEKWEQRVNSHTYSLLRWPLSNDGILNLLRHGDVIFTAGWLSGRYPNNLPTTALYTQLTDNPGHANLTRSQTGPHEDEQPVPFDGRLLAHLRGVSPEPDYNPDILATMGYTLREAPATVARAAAEVLADKLTDHFADDISAWNLAMTLAEGHTGSIDELVELVAATHT